MSMPPLKNISRLSFVNPKEYQVPFPMLFDDTLTQLQKMNKLIHLLNAMGITINELIDNWNELKDWLLGEGLESAILEQMETWLNDGTLADLINHQIFNDLNNEIDYLKKRVEDIGVNVLNFGAIGDGITDDTVAFENALDYAISVGKPLFIPSDTTIKISKRIERKDKNVSIIGGGDTSVIFVDNQNYDPLVFGATLFQTQRLVNSATFNTDYITVSNGYDFKKGMIIELVSSKSWYLDPRADSTDTRKGEVSMIERVDGNKIFLSTPLNDSYDLSDETVEVNVYNPISVRLENFTLQMTLGAVTVNAVRKTGITVSYAYQPTIKNVNVLNAAATGILMNHCYYGIVEGGRSHSSNNFYSGYGVQITGCTRFTVRGRQFANCRRGVDVSGIKLPSRFITVEDCTAFGSGNNSEGTPYGFLPDGNGTGAPSFGFGSHGGADHTIFRNNILGRLYVGINIRSMNTVVEGNYFVGDFRVTCVDVAHGANITIENNRVLDNVMGVKNNSVFDGGANRYTRIPRLFVRLQDNSLSESGSKGFYNIKNNITTVYEAFIEFSNTNSGVGAIGNINNLIVTDNIVLFSPPVADGTVYGFNNNNITGTLLLSGSVFKNNTFKRIYGEGSIITFNGCDPRNGTEIGTSSHMFYIPTNTAEKIWVGNNLTNFVRIAIDCSQAHGLVRVSSLSTDLVAWGDTLNLNGMGGVALTGTTGLADMINLSLKDGILYIENRRASTQRIVVTVFGRV